MRNIFIKAALLLVPFLIMISVNEISRAINSGNAYSIYGVETINSSVKTPQECSWNCHNSATYCKRHHVKFLKNYFAYTDLPYNLIIRLLRATGNYINANIIFLVFLFPLFIWLMLIKSLDISKKINQLNEEE